MKRRRASVVHAAMLSRYVSVGDIVSGSGGDRFIVTERLTRDSVRIRELTRWERFCLWLKGWWPWTG